MTSKRTPNQPLRQPTDWRAHIMRDLPEAPRIIRGASFDSAIEVIETAAFNRRMSVEDYIGRAALAVAVFDGAGEETWDSIMEKEPPLRDLRLRSLPRRRMRGRGFGGWKIIGMVE